MAQVAVLDALSKSAPKCDGDWSNIRVVRAALLLERQGNILSSRAWYKRHVSGR